MKTSEILNQEENQSAKSYQSRMFEKIVIQMYELKEPVTLDELSLLTDIQKDILQGFLTNIKGTENAKLKHIREDGKLRGRGYILTPKGRIQAQKLNQSIIHHDKALKEAEAIKQKEITTESRMYVLFIILSIVGGFFIGLGMHETLMRLFAD